MTSFKQFLLEAFDGGKPSYSSVDVETAINFLNAKCRNSLWMLEPGSDCIFRGDDDFEKLSSPFALIDTTKTTRRSQNTSNYYTSIFDNIPSMQGFPKRSKSLICTNSEDTASLYGKGRALIPTDSAKIGVVGQPDIWDLNVKIASYKDDITTFNEIFSEFLASDDYESFVKFDKRIRDRDPKAIAELTFALEKWNVNDGAIKLLTKDFLGTIDKAYSPAALKLKNCTTATLPRKAKETEMWVEGEVVIIDLDMWMQLKVAYSELYGK